MEGKFKSLKGQFLLDGGKLRGSYFNRTVVLICQHDPEGAFGLVLNRDSGSTVGQMVVSDLPESLKALPLHLGGPVQPAALSFLHLNPLLPEANVLPNLSLGHSLEALVELGAGESFNPQNVQVFAGYSGWSPGQLEDELQRDAWVTHPASALQLFRDPSRLWQDILKQKGWPYRLLAQGPEDLTSN